MRVPECGGEGGTGAGRHGLGEDVDGRASDSGGRVVVLQVGAQQGGAEAERDAGCR
ncbi:hypothetical protein [Streptomyces sp. NPDC096311]|uniref:hypothetical protein n=1 Tax=Streptomyces sp. NPDC096311 TaxID=3366083 RepID=UPI003816CD34